MHNNKIFQSKEIWEKIITALQSDEFIDPIIFNDYLKNSKIFQISENECLITADSAFSKDLLDSNFSPKIKNILKKITNLDFNVKFIDPVKIEKLFIKENKTNFLKAKTSTIFNFENFIQDSSNNQVYKISKNIIDNTHSILWNPIFIKGGIGVGKTHILKAIAFSIKNNITDNRKVEYIQIEDFKEYIRNEDIKKKMLENDIFLIDDIQLLENEDKKAFLNLLNNLINKNKIIVITSDKNIENIENLDKRTKSRMQSGLSFTITKPSKIMLERIINSEIAEIDNDVLNFLIKNFGNDIRKLKGAINKIKFLELNYNKEDNVLNANDIFNDFNLEMKISEVNNTKNNSIKKIQNMVANKFNISLKDLLSDNKKRDFTIPRHIAIYLIKELLNESVTKISHAFGKKEHSTIIYACKKIEDLCKKDKFFQNDLETIKKEILEI